MIHSERIRALNREPPVAGRFVLYWMQASQRAHGNHALELAIRLANERDEPVVVLFGLTQTFPEANLRHYAFMLQGLLETRAELARRGIQFVVWRASPERAALKLGAEASVIVTDCGYLRIQRQWRDAVAASAGRLVLQVESDVVVPLAAASPKQEWAARTLRPKLQKLIPTFLQPLRETAPRRDSLGLLFDGLDITDPLMALQATDVDRSVPPSVRFTGGASHAAALLEGFISERLEDYAERRSDPAFDWVSHMSPYLHFGQIAPLEIALRVLRAGGGGISAYLEELVVRRELAMNYAAYNPMYDSYAGLPQWARATLKEHRNDPREASHTLEQLEDAQTEDPYWNAAQRELVQTGLMHGYMRMYWGKRLLAWLPTPEAAFDAALFLNNKYALDGRDPCSYVGVGWCLGLHDRPWKERPIYGTVRYMSAAGLERRFDMDGYCARVAG